LAKNSVGNGTYPNNISRAHSHAVIFRSKRNRFAINCDNDTPPTDEGKPAARHHSDEMSAGNTEDDYLDLRCFGEDGLVASSESASTR